MKSVLQVLLLSVCCSVWIRLGSVSAQGFSSNRDINDVVSKIATLFNNLLKFIL